MSASAPYADPRALRPPYEADAGLRGDPDDYAGRHLLCYPLIKSVASPAAGAEWSVAVPSGRTWLVRGVSYRFVTAAAVANRLPILTLGDGTLTPVRIAASSVQAATLTEDYNHVRGGGVQYQAGTPAQNTLPLWLEAAPGGFVIGTSTQNLQAADQYSAITLYVIEARHYTDNELAQLRAGRGRGQAFDNYPGILLGD